MPSFGRIYAPDSRDRRFPMRLVLEETPFPTILEKRDRVYRSGPVLDQGQTGTCVGHGWAGWLQGAPLMTKTGPAPFAIYDAAILIDEWNDNDYDPGRQFGTSVRAGVQVLQSLAHVKSYVWAESVDDIRAWHLAGLGTVVLGLNWYEGMMETTDFGYIYATGGVVGGHCIKSTGWSDKRDALRIQNSWGVSWGQFGRAWIPRKDLEFLLADQGEACAATEQKLRAA